MNNKIYLKELNKNDVNLRYLKWMNDRDIHKYTEQKYKVHKIQDIKKFVLEKKKSKNEFLYGIFLHKDNLHIGNIKLGPINFTHKFSEISYFIGDTNYWNKGYGSLAIKLIIMKAKKKKIKKLIAGCYELNVNSKKVLIKNNFKLEGKLRSHIFFKKKRYSLFLYGLIL